MLDVGCGRGATLLPAAERVGPEGRVLGIDLSSEMVSHVTRETNEQLVFRFPDEQAWWDWAWTHGMRGVLELLPPDDLENLRVDFLIELTRLRTAEGVAMPQSAGYVVAEKPAG